MKYTADFETLNTENCEKTYVWGWGICNLDNYKFRYGSTIKEFMTMLEFMDDNAIIYFHNLAFDGRFILDYLLNNEFKFIKDKRDKESKTFTTLISDMNQFFSIEIYFKVKGKRVNKVTILDSLKIIPFSVKKIAESFNLPIKKGEIDYVKFRKEGYKATQEELEYLKNDVEIVARALNVLFDQGLDKMTQASNALYHYKLMTGKKQFEKWFPILEYENDKEIRLAYKGGFTYCDPRTSEKDIGEGVVLDVNSLYPSRMMYELLPYGEPVRYERKYEYNKLYPLYVQKLCCKFDIKKNHIPTIQLKHNLGFQPNEYIKSSNGEYIIMTLTNVDLELFFDHYDVEVMEYLGGYMFKGTKGLFTKYINYWYEQKNKAKKDGNSGMYQLSKLMLNALYGKFALNPDVQGKEPYLDSNGIVKFKLGDKETRDGVYLPVGIFITAYGRNLTIRSAQKCYNRFMYADTDSLHLKGLELPEELEIDSSKLGAWDNEMSFSRARYLRQKSYIEQPMGSDKLKVTCAGLPHNLSDRVTWENFRFGLSIEGKKVVKTIKGGAIISETTFNLRK